MFKQELNPYFKQIYFFLNPFFRPKTLTYYVMLGTSRNNIMIFFFLVKYKKKNKTQIINTILTQTTFETMNTWPTYYFKTEFVSCYGLITEGRKQAFAWTLNQKSIHPAANSGFITNWL